MIVTFDAQLWTWDARRADSWTFLSLPAHVSGEIKELTDGPSRGFGSVRTRVTIGASTWKTSIFPDSKRRCYVLPIKQAVRNAESIEAGDITTITVEVLDLEMNRQNIAHRPSHSMRTGPGCLQVDGVEPN